jgi:hypothetical protein
VSALLIAWELIGVELEACPIENIKSLSKIQVANTISSSSSQFFIVGFTLAQPVITFLFFPHIIRRWREEKFQALITLLIAFFGLGMFAWALFVAVTRHDFSFLILAGIGFVVALTLAVLVRWIVSWLELIISDARSTTADHMAQ